MASNKGTDPITPFATLLIGLMVVRQGFVLLQGERPKENSLAFVRAEKFVGILRDVGLKKPYVVFGWISIVSGAVCIAAGLILIYELLA